MLWAGDSNLMQCCQSLHDAASPVEGDICQTKACEGLCPCSPRSLYACEMLLLTVLWGKHRLGAGSRYSPSKLPKQPLELWSYESSPFCKVCAWAAGQMCCVVSHAECYPFQVILRLPFLDCHSVMLTPSSVYQWDSSFQYLLFLAHARSVSSSQSF